MKRNRSHPKGCLFIGFSQLLILLVLITNGALASEFIWSDYREPYYQRIEVCHDKSAIVTLDLPASFFRDHKEISLTIEVTSDSYLEKHEDKGPSFESYQPWIRINNAILFGSYRIPVKPYPKTQTHQIKIKSKYLKAGTNTLEMIHRWRDRGSCSGDCCGFFVNIMYFPDAPQLLYALSISSTPSGADIYWDGINKGNTPTKIEASKGYHSIKLEKDGYKTSSENLWVDGDRDYSYALERKEVVDTEPPEIKISSPHDTLKTHDEKILLKGKVIDNLKVSRLRIVLNNRVLHDENDLVTFQEKEDNVSELYKEVKLDTGRNDIIVEATDQAGNKAQESLAVFRIVPVAEKPAKIEKLVTLPKEGKYYAVVIGIGKYQDHRIPKLKYTTVDAQSVYKTLTDPQYGNFPKNQVKLLIDEQATDNKIKSAIGTWLRRNTRKDDTVIIFFAGHGAPEDEKTYWVTYNANIDDLYATALSNDEISDMLDRVEAKKMVAFLDSCYSAATIDRTDKKRSIMIVKDPFQKFKGKGRVIITSSDGKEESLEIEKLGHGVFTYYLLEALKGESDENKDGFIELDEVWDYVKHRVTDTARKHGSTQTPIIDGSYSAGIVLSKNPERLKELYLESEREKRKKELEEKIAKLTGLYSKGEITSGQFDKAISILESGEKNKLLDDFLSDRISLTTFRRVFK